MKAEPKSIDPAVLASIQAIVNYDWATEAADYERENKPEGHVFLHLQKVQEWLTQINPQGG